MMTDSVFIRNILLHFWIYLCRQKTVDHFYQYAQSEYFIADDTYGPGKGVYFQ